MASCCFAVRRKRARGGGLRSWYPSPLWLYSLTLSLALSLERVGRYERMDQKRITS